ncbi:gliding motility-associated C-terminal domain-containing protein [Neolewinella aurantiaca]|uniref:Gliding motility-associated C-terminal domain-containing protein n=1 Tax=Neolewinella aurantiaca TaxID=2602767 RepID=A0A5C7FSE2_9BACT|nr:gliding motility-associated C-terminal domain-containing protein [Neolewinella aurantiaca]TXF89118.1 gliding motility-associated C-terminal domain-containing protein [Neolewinella aurantiaca]
MRFLLCYFILGLAPALSAQIAAPDLLCTRSESGAVILNWENAAVGCGPYEATEIYSATAPDGPFSLLAEVNDPAETMYSDANPTGELRYYYMSYRYNCPGQTAMNSDTLDSFIPRSPVVRYVSVEDNEIIIDWRASSSPEVTGYIILEVTPTAFIPLDTVYGVTDYRFPFSAADPDPASREFRLVAIDPCGNDSPQGSIVSAMNLSATGGSGCTSEITLMPDLTSLSRYLPATALELFVSTNGSAYVSAGTFGPAAPTVDYDGANDGDDLCFYLEAAIAENNSRARSTVFCTSVVINQPARQMDLYGVEVSDNGDLLFQYDASVIQPVLTESVYLIARTNGVLEQDSSLPTDLTAAGGQATLAGPLADPLESGETVAFRLTDDCMREITTNAVEPVYLTATEFFPGQHQLSWTPLINGLAGETTYDVFRTDAGSAPVTLATGLTDLRFLDENSGAGGEVCYEIRATFRPEGAATAETYVFSSNTDCITPVSEVFVPNAFSPNGDGINDVFRPFFSPLPAEADYELLVFDRWGALVFESNVPLEGWDGSYRGKLMTNGVFVYSLRYQAREGLVYTRSGTVNLLR